MDALHPKDDFALKVRLTRTLMNMRQETLAEAFGVNVDTICAWETGRREPSASKQRLLVILGEREGLSFTPKGYPEYAERPSTKSPAIER